MINNGLLITKLRLNLIGLDQTNGQAHLEALGGQPRQRKGKVEGAWCNLWFDNF